MKKNLLTIMITVAMLTASTAAFAEATPAPTAVPAAEEQLTVMPVSETADEEFTAPVSMPSYISNTVTVTEAGEGRIATTLNKEDAENPENTINYTIQEDTLVFSSKGEKKEVKDIEKGADITVFTNSYSPAPLIMPPQYQANVIIINDDEQIGSVDVDTYLADGERLINAANSLVLNIGETTEIVDKEGKAVKADELKNKDLVVFYTITTRSIPAQTPPEKIVVIGENETALAQIEATKNEATATPAPTAEPEATEEPTDNSKINAVKVNDKEIENIYKSADGTVMVPLRKIAEELGFTVDWDGNLRAVILNSGMYSLKIDENSYVKGKMMPVELCCAPEIKDDLTYVPVEYFTEVLEATANIEGNTYVITNAQ